MFWKCVGTTEKGDAEHYTVVERHRLTGKYRTRRLQY
jgi:hypothetical protein